MNSKVESMINQVVNGKDAREVLESLVAKDPLRSDQQGWEGGELSNVWNAKYGQFAYFENDKDLEFNSSGAYGFTTKKKFKSAFDAQSEVNKVDNVLSAIEGDPSSDEWNELAIPLMKAINWSVS